MQVDHEYRWADDWPVWYSVWGSGYPKTEASAPRCVAQRKMSDFGDFEWIEDDCKAQKGSLCIIRSHKPPMKPIDVEGKRVKKHIYNFALQNIIGECPYNSGESKKFSTKCVWEVKQDKIWQDADLECGKLAKKYGSHLPGFLMSAHSVHDVEFLLKEVNAGDSWIGLTTDRQGGWEWSDGTAVQVYSETFL